MKYVRVRGILSIAHRGTDGVLHGHSYEVWALFHSGDAVSLMVRLNAVLAELDHSEVPAALARGEDLAEWVGLRVDAFSVTVLRPVEGFESGWIRD